MYSLFGKEVGGCDVRVRVDGACSYRFRGPGRQGMFCFHLAEVTASETTETAAAVAKADLTNYTPSKKHQAEIPASEQQKHCQQQQQKHCQQ